MGSFGDDDDFGDDRVEIVLVRSLDVSGLLDLVWESSDSG